MSSKIVVAVDSESAGIQDSSLGVPNFFFKLDLFYEVLDKQVFAY